MPRKALRQVDIKQHQHGHAGNRRKIFSIKYYDHSVAIRWPFVSAVLANIFVRCDFVEKWVLPCGLDMLIPPWIRLVWRQEVCVSSLKQLRRGRRRERPEVRFHLSRECTCLEFRFRSCGDVEDGRWWWFSLWSEREWKCLSFCFKAMTYLILPNKELIVKARLHKRFLSQQLEAIFVEQNRIRLQTCSKPLRYRGDKSHLVYTSDFEAATLARQKLHRVAATKIACVSGP